MASSYGEDASKDALRSSYIAARKAMTARYAPRVDGDIARHLRALPAYQAASLILAYVATHDELDTAEVIRNALEDGKRVALPRVVGGPRSLAFWLAPDDQDPRAHVDMRGFVPPEGEDPLDSRTLVGTVCLVPGLVFDAEGYRVGYGAGYYDNYLAFYPGTKVGLVRSLQVSSNPLPHDDHDIPVDVLVSDAAVWMCRRDEEFR